MWFLIDNNLPAEYYGSVQGKNRPWVVVSNDTCNQYSPVITVVPLTTQTKNNLPTHVTYKVGDQTQTVLCEQLRTISINTFMQSGSNYRYTLSDDTMKRVEEAMAVQLGLSLTFPNSDRFWESLERLIRQRVKELMSQTKIDALDISKVAAMIDIKVDNIVKGECEKETVVEQSTESEPTVIKKDFVPVKARVRRTWNNEQKKEFLDYYYKYGTEKTCEKFNMGKSTVYTTANKFQKELRDAKAETK